MHEQAGGVKVPGCQHAFSMSEESGDVPPQLLGSFVDVCLQNAVRRSMNSTVAGVCTVQIAVRGVAALQTSAA